MTLDQNASVRVPDERLDEQERTLKFALDRLLIFSVHGEMHVAAADESLAALVADLRAARADNQRLREALLLALNVLGDERLHPEASDTPLGVPGCLACDAIAAGEMALAEEPRA